MKTQMPSIYYKGREFLQAKKDKQELTRIKGFKRILSFYELYFFPE